MPLLTVSHGGHANRNLVRRFGANGFGKLPMARALCSANPSGFSPMCFARAQPGVHRVTKKLDGEFILSQVVNTLSPKIVSLALAPPALALLCDGAGALLSYCAAAFSPARLPENH